MAHSEMHSQLLHLNGARVLQCPETTARPYDAHPKGRFCNARVAQHLTAEVVARILSRVLGMGGMKGGFYMLFIL